MALPKIFKNIDARVKKSGDIMSGNLIFNKDNNGEAKIYKNSSSTNDYGLQILDETKDYLNSARLILCANPDRDNLVFQLNNTNYLLYGEHNKPEPLDIKTIKVYYTLSELGLEETNASPEAIVNAMENKSMLLTYLGATASTSSALLPPWNYGTLKVIKFSSSYTMFEYQATSNNDTGLRLARAYYNAGAAVVSKWSGWHLVVDNNHKHDIEDINDLQEALDNRFNIGEAGTSIPNGADLNSYTTIGNYYSISSSVSTTLLNCPITGSGFRLVVMRGYNSTVPIQLIFAYGINVYYRSYQSSASTWSDWVNLVDAVKLRTARKINSVSFNGTQDIYFNGSYNTATNPASLPKGLSYIELPATATSTGDPTYGVCLTVFMSNVRAFQIGINNAGRMYTRSAHTNHTDTTVPGYSDWKQVWRSGDNIKTPFGTDYSTVRARNTGAGTGSAPSSLNNGEMWVKY